MPQLGALFFVIGARTCAERVHGRAANVSHLLLVEALFFQETVDVKLGELERTLVHALLLDPDDFAVARH